VLLQALAEVRVESVLDRIISAAIDTLGDIAPAIAMDQVQPHNEEIFLHRPLSLGDVRVQVVVPALAALLSNATRKVLCYLCPILGAQLNNNYRQDLVLLLRPGAFRKMTAIDELEPTCVTFDL